MAYMPLYNMPILFLLMASRLFGAKTLSVPMLPYCRLDPKEYISVKFYFTFKKIFIQENAFEIENIKKMKILSVWYWVLCYKSCYIIIITCATWTCTLLMFTSMVWVQDIKYYILCMFYVVCTWLTTYLWCIPQSLIMYDKSFPP